MRDPLVDPPATETEIVQAARRHVLDRNWDLAVCLTDLPLRIRRRPVIAQANATNGVALISLPALGPLGIRRRSADAVVQMIAVLLGSTDGAPRRSRVRLGRRLIELGAETPDSGRMSFPLRVLGGNLRLLAGMVAANRPWKLALGLSRAVATAIATLIFALVTSDLWRLGDTAGPWRSSILTVIAIAAPTVTLIVSAGLWERTTGPAREQVVLFNVATFATLLIGIVTLLVVLVGLSLAGSAILISPTSFASAVHHPVGAADYVRVGWTTGSLATLAGALGAGLETDAAIRAAAYRSWPDEQTERDEPAAE
jgi:hypothetical protein